MINTAELMCFAATRAPDAARRLYRDVPGLTLLQGNRFALVVRFLDPDGNGWSLTEWPGDAH